MNLKTLLFTKNACYFAGKTITPKGVMVHSTGANNPNLKRYVGPDDGLLGKNQNNNHWNQDNPDGRQVCVHAFIGKLADGTIATYQTLPWNHRGWHAGGDANNTHISFEICEDGLTDAVVVGNGTITLSSATSSAVSTSTRRGWNYIKARRSLAVTVRPTQKRHPPIFAQTRICISSK